jgi:hypothetical protein
MVQPPCDIFQPLLLAAHSRTALEQNFAHQLNAAAFLETVQVNLRKAAESALDRLQLLLLLLRCH